MCKIYTARYSYSGLDRFDITVKGEKNLSFAPTWKMVDDYKKKIITNEEYTKIYLEKMRLSYNHHRGEWNKVLNMDEVTFVCFCKANSFCHRYILTELFVNLGAIYLGERKGVK